MFWHVPVGLGPKEALIFLMDLNSVYEIQLLLYLLDCIVKVILRDLSNSKLLRCVGWTRRGQDVSYRVSGLSETEINVVVEYDINQDIIQLGSDVVLRSSL